MGYSLNHNSKKNIFPGKCYPLGATPSEKGVNFAIYSQSARDIFLLLFDNLCNEPTDIIRIQNTTKNIWHVFIEGIKDGQLYAYKIKGDYNPAHGFRFNENKLLIDPYSKALTGKFLYSDNLLLAYNPASQDKDLSFDVRDDSAVVPKSVVVNDAFDWQDDSHPDIPIEKIIIYEVHVKGFTAHTSSGVQNPGTYTGFIEKIPYLTSLGINAVEFLPVHEYYIDDFLTHKKLTNYWGYNSIAFFAPESSYGTGSYPGCQVNEFKTMVRELHRAGIEVILDVVYNHTGEGNELGPTISLKGIDNPTYYCLTGNLWHPGRYYMNYTGCGNSLNLSNVPVIRLVLDSLRYWVEVMHVDGFRFDLASVLGRDGGDFHKSASFFDAISQDPVLNHVKLIAEPWDLGTFQVGNFPIDWCEWNGKFRDTLRKFGKGDQGQMAELGWRITGSADLYGDDGRSAYNSINFITCHDGFTLYDLVSYNDKHNEANFENNCDGTNDNYSWNCGVEGESDNPEIMRLRKKLIKNYFTYLLFSLGTPMILGGDEFMRTQRGNNNAYCQDNEISWFNWNGIDKNRDVVDFVKKCIAFTREYTVLQKRKFQDLSKDSDGNSLPLVTWYGKDGNIPDWADVNSKTLCFMLDGSEVQSDNAGYKLFFILNADHHSRHIILPGHGINWARIIDTSLEYPDDFLSSGMEVTLNPQQSYHANSRSTVLLLGR